MCEFLNRYWSNEVHAGSAMEAIGLALARKLVEVYEPAKMADLRSRYIDKIRQRAAELRQGKIINAPWRDAVV